MDLMLQACIFAIFRLQSYQTQTMQKYNFQWWSKFQVAQWCRATTKVKISPTMVKTTKQMSRVRAFFQIFFKICVPVIEITGSTIVSGHQYHGKNSLQDQFIPLCNELADAPGM